MKIIESLNNPLIKNLSKLHQKKYRDIEKKFLVEGEHLVNEAYKANKLTLLLTSDSEFSLPSVKRIIVNDQIIKKLSTTKTPQKVIGICDFLENRLADNVSRVLLLDDIQDPGNLGTLVRSSLGFNIDKVYLSENSVDIYNDKFIRASQGAIFHIDIETCNLYDLLNKFKNDNFTVLGTSVNDGVVLEQIEVPSKFALILGNEGRGINDKLLSITDKNIYIETNPKLESLNIAVAGGIILHHFKKNPE